MEAAGRLEGMSDTTPATDASSSPSTAEGRAKNRRIAITILPDELVGADTAPAAKPNVDTNSLPVAPITDAPVLPQQ